MIVLSLDCSQDKQGVQRDVSDENTQMIGKQERKKLGYYKMYVVSTQLKRELGVALIDSGSQVSRVESSLITLMRSIRTFKCME
jgi:hypothetical protein